MERKNYKMILLGLRDLNGREIMEILNAGSEVAIDKKLKDEFGTEKSNVMPKKQAQEPENFCGIGLENLESLPSFLQARLVRSVMLSLVTFVMQNRSVLRCDLLEQLVSKLNSNTQYKNCTFAQLLSMVFENGLSDTERPILEAKEAHLMNRAQLIMTFYFVRLLTDFERLETCMHMEDKKISFNFLNELEKGNYEDRKLAKVLNIYRNYFKKRTADKNDPSPQMYQEIYLAYQLDTQIQVMEKMMVSLLSFEKKPYLQNKMIAESDFLVNYCRNIELVLQEIGSLFSKGNQIKECRSPIQSLRTKTLTHTLANDSKTSPISEVLRMILDVFLDDFNRVAQMINRQAFENKKMLKNNPKFKAKASESWQIVESMLNFNTQTQSEEKIAEEDGLLNGNQLYEMIGNLAFNNLSKSLAEIFAPVLDQSKKPKIPKGTRDYTPLQMTIKSRAIAKIREIYKKHGAEEIDTPIFELKETLLGKYGEEGGKLIYDLEDQGGELLSLRYDLTVPFARYMGLNNLNKMKRFHIGKVYRRDQPNINRGRFREFYQCDLDIAGKTDVMLAEAELLKIIVEILSCFGLKFKVKISHRLLLEAMIECAKCDPKKFKMICSSVDKLDKEPWEAVEKELIYEKGLTNEQTTILKSFVLHKGKVMEVIQLARTQNLFGDNAKAKTSLAEMEKLENYLRIFKVNENIDFDLSLARGLDYYTGLIFEAVLVEGETALGSIAGGGRYDELIGMFSKDMIPAIGGSIGIERLFVILEEKYKSQCRASTTEFLVGSIGKVGTLNRKMEIVNEFWDAGLNTEFVHDEYPRPDKQLKFALEKKIPFIIWVGEEEVKSNTFKIKNLYLKKEVTVVGTELISMARQLSESYKKDLEEGKVVFEE